MWRFWRDGIEFIFHLSFPIQLGQIGNRLSSCHLSGDAFAREEGLVCSLLTHVLVPQLFPICLTCMVLSQSYRGLAQPRWEEHKSTWFGVSLLSQHQGSLSPMSMCPVSSQFHPCFPCRDVGYWYVVCPVFLCRCNPWQSLFELCISGLDLNYLNAILNTFCLFSLWTHCCLSLLPFLHYLFLVFSHSKRPH